MHCRVVQFQGTPERLDEALVFVKDEVVPRLQEAGGFKGISSLVDRSTGKFMSITFWESIQDVERTRQLSEELRGKAAEALGATFLAVEEYEVGQRLDAAGKATLHLQQ
jgi:heme-degrading monooxygenase HmoA